jgi:chromosomal replication initiator protein
MSTTPRKITVAKCLSAVAREVGMTAAELKTPTKRRRYSRPRQVVMWLARRHCGYSFPRIARCLGLRDHRTVMYGVRVVEERRESTAPFRALCDRLCERVTT